DRLLPSYHRDGVDLYQRAAGQRSYLDRRARRTRIAKPLSVDLVHGGKVREVVEKDRRLYHVIPAHSSRTQYFLDVVHHAVSLLDDAAFHHLAAGRVEWNLPSRVQESVGDNPLRVWANRRWRFFSGDL